MAALQLLLALHGLSAPPGALQRTPQRLRSIIPVMMPLGTPKVAYRPPGGVMGDWIDIYNRMYRERILFLGRQVDEDLANQLVAIMLYLDSEDNNKQISMYINSPGGSVPAGLAIFDTMRHIKSDVSTINIGLAASMGSFLLCGGTKGKRFALPNSRTMIHQPASGGMQGQASDIKIMAEQILSVREKCVKYYSELSGQPKEKVVRDLDRDYFMSAQEAYEYGLIDKVIKS